MAWRAAPAAAPSRSRLDRPAIAWRSASQDDGVGLPKGWRLETGAGVGLSVTRERIAELHPNGSSRFTVTSRHSGGTNVDISLPLRIGGEART